MELSLEEIVATLIGPIAPIGDSGVDSARLDNLKELTTLINDLISEVKFITTATKNSKESSVLAIHNHAKKFLENLKED